MTDVKMQSYKSKNIVFYIAICWLLPAYTIAQDSAIIDSIKQVIKTSESDTAQVSGLYALSKAYYDHDKNISQDYAESLLAVSKKNQNSLGQLNAYLLLSKIDQHYKKYNDAIIKDSIAFNIAKGLDNKTAIYKALTSLGISNQNKEKYEGAIDIYKEALINAELTENSNNVAHASLNLSRLYFKLFQYDKALQILLLLSENDEINNLSTVNLEEILSSIATIYSRIDDDKKALEYYERAYEISRQAGLFEMQINNLYEIGIIHRILRNRDKSIESLQKALIISEQTGIYLYKSKILRGLGYTYYFKKDYDNAAIFFQRNLEWAKEQKNDLDVAKAQLSLGQVYSASNQISRAKVMLDSAAKMFSKQKELTPSLEDRSSVYLSLYIVDVMTQNYGRETLDNYKKYISLRDSITITNQKEKIAAMEVAYRTEQKDEKIKLLTAENERQKAENDLQKLKAHQERNLKIGLIAGSILLIVLLGGVYGRYRMEKRTKNIIQLQKNSIEEKNKENELLIKEIHHRVKNNLQIILSLLRVQVPNTKEDIKAYNIILESQNKIKSLALIHENLYNANSFTKVPTANYLKNLINHIKDSYSYVNKHVCFNMNIDDADIKMTLAVPLGLIVNELITNSYKYAFGDPKGQNVITVNFNKTDQKDTYNLQVYDNGHGLPANFTIDSSKTFGLQMVKGLVEQLEGQMQPNKASGAGFDILVRDINLA